jgi:fucose 4-O-acetylase-like acetyltransferase
MEQSSSINIWDFYQNLYILIGRLLSGNGVAVIKKEARLYILDNTRALLIYLVVLGHIFEIVVSRKSDIAYTFIYLFHMPLFIFCSGYLAKFKVARLLKLISLYLLFQFLYILFAQIALGQSWITMQFTTPYWLMWYLLALVAYTTLVPVLDIVTNRKSTVILTILLSFAIGIAAGFDRTIGSYLSLSRMLYFFPFFVIGFCMRKTQKRNEFFTIVSNKYMCIVSGLITAVIALFVWNHNDMIDMRWLWGAFSYNTLADSGYSFLIRIAMYFFAIVISLFVLSLMPKGKLFVSFVGRRTLEVFLFHGFVLRLMKHTNVMYLIPGGFYMLGFVIMVSVCIVFAFASGVFTPTVWYNLFSRNGATHE